jgi:hypothetical protein
VKKALKRQAQDDHWGTITRQPGQGARLTYLRNAGSSKEALVKGGRFVARLLTSTLPTLRNENTRWPNVYAGNGSTCMRCGAQEEDARYVRFYCGGAAESDVREVRATLERDLNEILDAALALQVQEVPKVMWLEIC